MLGRVRTKVCTPPRDTVSSLHVGIHNVVDNGRETSHRTSISTFSANGKVGKDDKAINGSFPAPTTLGRMGREGYDIRYGKQAS